MPRYTYYCEECDGSFQVWHGMKEMQESCQLCLRRTNIVRVPQMSSIKKTETGKKKVGQMTNDYIEQNQQLLKEMKEEARNQFYDD